MGRKICFFICMAVFFLFPLNAEAYAVTKKEIYGEIAKNFMNRKQEFFIECPYNQTVQSLVARLKSFEEEVYYSALFEIADVTDNEHSLDDGDYLYANLERVYCRYTNDGLYFFNVSYFETKAQTRKVNKKIAELAREIRDQTKNRRERIRLAYQLIMEEITYDYRQDCDYSAYAGLFRKKTTVCNGYAMALYKLLNKLNIPCRFISGKVRDNGKTYLHAWNIVKVNGRWYNLDATNDDSSDGTFYENYYLVSDEEMGKHFKDPFYLTKKFQRKHKMG